MWSSLQVNIINYFVVNWSQQLEAVVGILENYLIRKKYLFQNIYAKKKFSRKMMGIRDKAIFYLQRSDEDENNSKKV